MMLDIIRQPNMSSRLINQPVGTLRGLDLYLNLNMTPSNHCLSLRATSILCQLWSLPINIIDKSLSVHWEGIGCSTAVGETSEP
jgi:hypothetical protein